MENIKGKISMKDVNKNRLISDIELYIAEINEVDKKNASSYGQKNYDPMQDLLKVYHCALRLVVKHKDLIEIDKDYKKFKTVAEKASDFTKTLFRFTTYSAELFNKEYFTFAEKNILERMQAQAEESCEKLVDSVRYYLFAKELNDLTVKISNTNQNLTFLTKQYKQKCSQIEKLEQSEAKYKTTNKVHTYQKKLKTLYSEMFNLKDKIRVYTSNLQNLNSKRLQLITKYKEYSGELTK